MLLNGFCSHIKSLAGLFWLPQRRHLHYSLMASQSPVLEGVFGNSANQPMSYVAANCQKPSISLHQSPPPNACDTCNHTSIPRDSLRLCLPRNASSENPIIETSTTSMGGESEKIKHLCRLSSATAVHWIQWPREYSSWVWEPAQRV